MECVCVSKKLKADSTTETVGAEMLPTEIK